jgi:NAD(P)-dependent dehydrogenase (short-subunit alcohol dehydrogenase family)
MGRSYVVTGGGRGIGRALVERLLGDNDAVVVIELDPAALTWVGSHPAGSRVQAVVGDAADEAVAEHAADLAQAAGTLAGWVNNAAVFRDASIHSTPVGVVADLIALNLGPALTGCATAIRRFLAAGADGAIVNVSSHQARQAVPGCLPYATAKAAIEGLTRALAVEYGPVRHPGQRRRARLDQHRALRGVPACARARRGSADRGGDACDSPGRPGGPP